MKIATLSTLALAASGVVGESAMRKNKMGTLMNLKTAHHEIKKSAGVFREGAYKSMTATKCTDGKAGEYSCENVDLQGALTHENMGSSTREGNDIWGTFYLYHPLPYYTNPPTKHSHCTSQLLSFPTHHISNLPLTHTQAGHPTTAVNSPSPAKPTALPSSRSSKAVPSNTLAVSPHKPPTLSGETSK